MTHIFLYGPSATGKSTIGQLLAEKLRLPFIDLDRVIETNAGMPIPKIMETQGETAFRDMETATLKESVGHTFSATNSQTKVIALGSLFPPPGFDTRPVGYHPDAMGGWRNGGAGKRR